MSLIISYVERLEDVVQPAVEFLSRERDLFAKPRIVVPTAGAKAWLWSELARELGGATGQDGKNLGDGIVANVEISYPGTIMSLLQPKWKPGDRDPWSFDALTFAVLDVITARRPLSSRFHSTSPANPCSRPGGSPGCSTSITCGGPR